MIKVSYQINEQKGIVTYTFEASKDDDFEALDNLCIAITDRAEALAVFQNSKQLTVQFKGLVSPVEND